MRVIKYFLIFMIAGGWWAIPTLFYYIKGEIAPYVSTIEGSKKAIDEINRLRGLEGEGPIKFDEQAFEFAMSRAKDMAERDYLSHCTPEGVCVEDLAKEKGLPFVCEACAIAVDELDAVKLWHQSPTHWRLCLTQPAISGAVACYKDKCVFIALREGGGDAS